MNIKQYYQTISPNIIKIIVKFTNNNNTNSFFEKHLHTVVDKVNWNYLSRNTNLPYTFFEKCLSQKKYLDKVNWESLSRNTNLPYTFFEKCLSQKKYLDK